MVTITRVEQAQPAWETEVKVELSDGSWVTLFSYYSDEISFSDAELVGLTTEEAKQLRHKRDVAYLQS